MYLSRGDEKGMLVVADSLLSMSVWPWTQENLDAARHTYDLQDPGYLTLNIDLVQMGVGGNDSWSEVGQPLPEYQVPSGNYSYRFYLYPAKIHEEGIPAAILDIKSKFRKSKKSKQ
jgi:beta-galactosidase